MRFVLHPLAGYSIPEHNDREKRLVIVQLSIHKIDQSWQQQGRFSGYVGKGGVGGIPGKYLGVRAFAETNDEMYMPILMLNFLREPEKFMFENGRHTFAYFRDTGTRSMDFGVPQELSNIFQRTFGNAQN